MRYKYHQRMLTHHSDTTSSLRIKNWKIDKFDDFSSDIHYNSKTYVFKDIHLIINQCESRRPKVRLRRTQSVHQPRSRSKRCLLSLYLNLSLIFIFSYSVVSYLKT